MSLRRHESALDRVLRDPSLGGLEIAAPPPSPVVVARPDPDGAFRFDELAFGDYELSGYAPGHDRVVRGPLEVGPLGAGTGEHSPVVLRLGVGRQVAGSVVDDSGSAVPGASIHLWRAKRFPEPSELLERRPEGHSDATGAFRIEGVRPGNGLRLAVSAPGHVTVLSPVELDRACSVRLPVAHRARGRVTRSDTRPVREARVRLVRQSETPPAGARVAVVAEAVTDGTGTFRFDGLARGTYRPSVDCWAGRWEGPPVVVGAVEPSLDIVLEAARSLCVRALDPSGAPLAGAHIRVERAGAAGSAGRAHSRPVVRAPAAAPGDPLGSAPPQAKLVRTTDADGRASFFGLDGGPWRVRGSAPGRTPAEALAVPVGSPAERPTEVELVLSPAGGVRLEVRGGRDEPIAGVRVRLRRVDQVTVPPRPGLSDARGIVEWKDVPPGPYLAVHDPDWVARSIGQSSASRGEPSSVAVDVVPGEDTLAVLELEREAMLTATVGRAGTPVPGATLMLVERSAVVELAWRAETRLGSARTGPEGTAALPPVRPGAYVLCVRASRNALLRTFDIDLASGYQAAHVELDVSRVRGSVLGQGGEPLSGATVRLVPSMFAGVGTGHFLVEDPSSGEPILWAPGQVSVASAADGSFEFTDVEAGPYRVEIEAPGHAPWSSEELEFQERSSRELAPVTLSTSCAVSGFVLDAQASRRERVDFVSLQTEAGRPVGACVPEADGSYRFYDLPLGRYRIVATLGGREVPGDLFEVSLEAVTVQDLVLR